MELRSVVDDRPIAIMNVYIGFALACTGQHKTKRYIPKQTKREKFDNFLQRRPNRCSVHCTHILIVLAAILSMSSALIRSQIELIGSTNSHFTVESRVHARARDSSQPMRNILL